MSIQITLSLTAFDALFALNFAGSIVTESNIYQFTDQENRYSITYQIT